MTAPNSNVPSVHLKEMNVLVQLEKKKKVVPVAFPPEMSHIIRDINRLFNVSDSVKMQIFSKHFNEWVDFDKVDQLEDGAKINLVPSVKEEPERSMTPWRFSSKFMEHSRMYQVVSFN